MGSLWLRTGRGVALDDAQSERPAQAPAQALAQAPASARKPVVRATRLPTVAMPEAPAAVVSAVDQVRALESRAADPRPLCRDPWCPRRVDVPGRLCAEHIEQHKPRPGVESRATMLGLRNHSGRGGRR